MPDREWNNNQCTMNLVTYYYRNNCEERIVEDIKKMIKNFQVAMKQRYRISPSLVEKYKDDICFMIETNVTCMGEMELRVKFIDPMGYEMSEDVIEGYVKIMLKFEKDKDSLRRGTYAKKIKEVERKLYSKEIKKNMRRKLK